MTVASCAEIVTYLTATGTIYLQTEVIWLLFKMGIQNNLLWQVFGISIQEIILFDRFMTIGIQKINVLQDIG